MKLEKGYLSGDGSGGGGGSDDGGYTIEWRGSLSGETESEREARGITATSSRLQL